ncbi:MAG: hypothetical protein QOC67_3521, partial [Pseudonocardiales bacterium]|nr:hypothetical protein [Pseudonocardiales bacterium]
MVRYPAAGQPVTDLITAVEAVDVRFPTSRE